jgi:cytochrome c
MTTRACLPHISLLSTFVLASCIVGCGSANAESPQNPNPADQSHKGNTAEVVEGAPVYLANCAKCHGPVGRGGDETPPVVGDDALPLNPGPKSKVRKTQFVTAKDVFDFMRTNMPKDKPGSLTDDQYYAILTFDLKLNGVDLHGAKVDPTTVGTIRLPKR